MQTAEATARRLGLTVASDPGLLDVDCGQWQGHSPDEVQARWPFEFEQYLHAPGDFQFPGGESLEHARSRAWAHVIELAGQHPAETIMLVSHTALNRLILLSVLGLDAHSFWNVRQDTCAINVFVTDADRLTLVTLNETGHLLAVSPEANAGPASNTV
jgi:probable phosphoglycerate mutase